VVVKQTSLVADNSIKNIWVKSAPECRLKTDNGRKAGCKIAGPEKVFFLLYFAQKRGLSQRLRRLKTKGGAMNAAFSFLPGEQFVSREVVPTQYVWRCNTLAKKRKSAVPIPLFVAVGFFAPCPLSLARCLPPFPLAPFPIFGFSSHG
jgi:hypothetical protein